MHHLLIVWAWLAQFLGFASDSSDNTKAVKPATGSKEVTMLQFIVSWVAQLFSAPEDQSGNGKAVKPRQKEGQMATFIVSWIFQLMEEFMGGLLYITPQPTLAFAGAHPSPKGGFRFPSTQTGGASGTPRTPDPRPVVKHGWQPATEQEVEDRLNTLIKDDTQRQALRKVIAEWHRNGTIDHIINMVTGKTDLGLTGEHIKFSLPLNIYTLKEDERFSTKQRAWGRLMEATKDLGSLIRLGVLPGLTDLDVSIRWEEVFEPNKAKDYLKDHPEITPEKLATAAMFYMATQIHKLSYQDNRGFAINSGNALMAKTRQTKSIWMDEEKRDRKGRVIDVQVPGHLNVPSYFDSKDWRDISIRFQVAVHGAPSDNEKTTLAVSRKYSNDGVEIEDVFNLIPTAKDAGKVMGKRQPLTKIRAVAHLFYGLVLLRPMCGKAPVTWALPNGDIRVAVEKALNGAGDGSAITSSARMKNFLVATGETPSSAKKLCRRTRAFHFTIETDGAVYKGNIIVYPDKLWPRDSKTDLIIDEAGISAIKLAKEHKDRVTILLDPIRVDGDKGLRLANAEQLEFEMGMVIDPVYYETAAQNIMRSLERNWAEKHLQALTTFTRTLTGDLHLEDEDDAVSGVGKSYRQEDLFNQEVRAKKSAYFARSNGMYDSRVSVRPYAARTLSDVEKVLKELEEKGYGALFLPSISCRIIAGHYAPLGHTPPKGGISFLKDPKERHPWLLIVDDELLVRIRPLLEGVDGDDSVLVTLMRTPDGSPKAHLIKIPTSPFAGYIVDIDEETVKMVGTDVVPMLVDDGQLTLEEIEEVLKDPQYTAVKLGDSNSSNPQVRDARIRIKDSTTTKDYADQVARVYNALGALPVLSDLATLARRSGLWRGEVRAVYARMAHVILSTGVDANVNRTESILPMIDDLADAIVMEVHRGAGLDMKFLRRKEHIVRKLSKRYDSLRSRRVINPLEKTLRDVDGNILPADCTAYDWLWTAAAQIPQQLHDPIRRVAAILQAVSHGPIAAYTSFDAVIDEKARKAAEWVMPQLVALRSPRQDDPEQEGTWYTWQEQEIRFEKIANRVEERLQQRSSEGSYTPGNFSRALAQLIAVKDSNRSVGKRVDAQVPTGLSLPVHEYLGMTELDAFFADPSVPTVFMPVQPDHSLVKGHEYVFEQDGSGVNIQAVGVADVDEEFAHIANHVAARCNATKGKEWAAIANGATMVFAGFVAWSTGAKVNDEEIHPVAIFVPDLAQILDWTV